MAQRRRTSIEQWITDALSDADKGGPCTALSLVYVKAGGAFEEIHTKQLKGATHNAKDLAAFFMNKAQGFCQDLPGISTCKLQAFYGGDQPMAAFPFTIADGEFTAGGEVAFARHEPSQQGLLAQLMKHNEQVTSMLMQIAQTVTIQAVTREAQLRSEVAEAQAIVRDVIMNMTKEQHQNRMAELTFMRQSEERKMLAGALPSLINSVTGSEVIPQSHADTLLLDALALKVKPEHLQALQAMGLVTNEQATLLAARFSKTLEQQEQQRAALKLAPSEDQS